jgi:predicted nuclease of predicted toxin-antitoxin system
MDEHIHPAVAAALRARGVDVVTTQEIDLLSASDEHLLNSACQQGRVLFSFDADFARLHAAGHQHAGIVYASRQTAIGQQVRSLLLIYQILSPEEMINHLEFI